MRPLGFIYAPTTAGLRRDLDGRERQPSKLPQPLAQGGLIERSGATQVEVLPHPPYPENEQWVGDSCDVSVVCDLTLTMADTITRARVEGFAPLVGGDDNAVLLGCGLVHAPTDRYALVYLDAHHDYHHLGNAGAFDVASADLAVVAGSSTDLLTNIESRRPCFCPQDALVLGSRSVDDGERRKHDELPRAGIGLITLEDGRTVGMEWVGRALAESFEKQPELDGFWVHLDADVLDPSIMPIVNRPEPGGLAADELTTLLARLVLSPRFTGMNVTILDHELDADGSSQCTLADILAKALTTSKEPTPS